MSASTDLLARIEQDASIAKALAWPPDFDITRRTPIEEVVLPNGTPLHAIAGSASGGTYFLCGDVGAQEQPVLYADSEGQAALVGADLIQAVILVVVLPFWQDLAKGFAIGNLNADFHNYFPDYESERLLNALGLPPTSQEEAASRLAAIAARTAPNYVPFVPVDGYDPYSVLSVVH